MEHLLFAGYLILFAWLVTRIKFFTSSGLTPPQLMILFLVKVMAAIFYGWIGVYYGELAQMVDTWMFHYDSLHEQQVLLQDPGRFFSELFHNPYAEGYTRFLSAHNSWWNDFHYNFFVKLLAFFNMLSGGNYYVNSIFYSFLTLFGPVALFRLMQDAFPQRKVAVLLSAFFIPSFLYWTSGIHKDGIMFLGLALLIYQFYHVFREKRFTTGRVLRILFSILLIMLVRNYVLLLLLPGLLAWGLAVRFPARPLLPFAFVYGLGFLLFFTTRYLHPKLDFPQTVVTRQQEFHLLHGNSAVEVAELEPTFGSFMRNAPQAFQLSVLRPYPTDVNHLLSFAATLEIGLCLLLFLLFLGWRDRSFRVSPFLLFCLFFSFSILMLIGYTVHFLGAIVRYRSIVLPLVMTPVIAGTDWKRLGAVILQNIRLKTNI